MNILVISHLYPQPHQPEFGIFVKQQIEELVRQGHSVQVVSPVGFVPKAVSWLSGKWRCTRRLAQHTRDGQVEVYHPRCIILPRRLNYRGLGGQFYKAIRKVFRDSRFVPDIIHAHTAFPDGWAAMKFSRHINVPLVVTVHGQSFSNTLSRYPWAKSRIQKVYDNSATVTVSPSLWQKSEPYLQLARGTRVIPNGVNVVEEYGGTKKKKLITFVGHLIPLKGADILIRAFSQLPVPLREGFKVAVTGDGRELKNLQKLAWQLKVAQAVDFTGPLPHHEVLKRLAVSQLFVLPSWNEGFGMVYLEALSQGTPIIACKHEGISSYIKPGIHGWLVERKDVASLRAALIEALTGQEKLLEMGEEGRKLVLEEFTWQVNVRKYTELYKTLRRTGNG